MSVPPLPALPVFSVKNIVVTVTEVDGKLVPQCPELIGCSTADTLFNFQMFELDADRDYRFANPDLKDPNRQFGNFTISRSGKMLTSCNGNTARGNVHITLHVYDHDTPELIGSFDPEVANQPDGL